MNTEAPTDELGCVGGERCHVGATTVSCLLNFTSGFVFLRSSFLFFVFFFNKFFSINVLQMCWLKYE